MKVLQPCTLVKTKLKKEDFGVSRPDRCSSSIPCTSLRPAGWREVARCGQRTPMPHAFHRKSAIFDTSQIHMHSFTVNISLAYLYGVCDFLTSNFCFRRRGYTPEYMGTCATQTPPWGPKPTDLRVDKHRELVARKWKQLRVVLRISVQDHGSKREADSRQGSPDLVPQLHDVPSLPSVEVLQKYPDKSNRWHAERGIEKPLNRVSPAWNLILQHAVRDSQSRRTGGDIAVDRMASDENCWRVEPPQKEKKSEDTPREPEASLPHKTICTCMICLRNT